MPFRVTLTHQCIQPVIVEKIHIPDLFKAIAEKVNARFSTRTEDPFDVYFDYGHYDAVNKNLINKDGSISMKDQKYPLIWMITPFDEKTSAKHDYYAELSGLDFLIMVETSQDETIPERIAKYYVPRIYPILREFFHQIEASGFFQVLSADAIPYDAIKDWYYHSNSSGTNLFNTHIDSTQVKNIRLRVNESVPDDHLIN